MGPLEDFVGCTINLDLINTTLMISQLHLIKKMSEEFNNNMKTIMNFNTPDTPHKGIARNQEIYKNTTFYRRYTGV